MNQTTAAALALALGTAMTLAAIPASTADTGAEEKCLGVALQAKHDCQAGPDTSRAGSATQDDQSHADKL